MEMWTVGPNCLRPNLQRTPKTEEKKLKNVVPGDLEWQ